MSISINTSIGTSSGPGAFLRLNLPITSINSGLLKSCILYVKSCGPTFRVGKSVKTLNKQDIVQSFLEKPEGDGAWINGGFFVCEPEVFDFISSDQTIWEREPMEKIASKGQMSAFKHNGFWKPMDTLREKKELENFWNKGNAPWKIWK